MLNTSTFIVWLQQMSPELAGTCKTFWTVSRWVHFCTSVNANMTFQIAVGCKHLPTVRTATWSNVAMYVTFVSLQDAGLTETFVTQWTHVRFLSCVDSHMIVQTPSVTKGLVTHLTFVRFLSCVDSHVSVQISRLNKYLITHLTFVRILFTVNSDVYSRTYSHFISFVTNITFK